MAAEAGCSSWRIDNDPDEGDLDEDDEILAEPADVDVDDEEGVNVSNSSLMPPPLPDLHFPPSPLSSTTSPVHPLLPPPVTCHQNISHSSSNGQPSSSLDTCRVQQEVALKMEDQDRFATHYVSSSGSGPDSESRVPWHRTPEVVMVKILTYLCDADRCSVCLTCHAWRRPFRHPYLWKTRHFYFGGFEALEKQDVYSKFLAQLGCHVQHATVELGRPNINTASTIARAFEAFVFSVTKCPGLHLLSITVVSADFLSGWHFFSHNRGKVIRSLCCLLKKQSGLRSADLSYCLMDRDEGSRLLEALNHGTRFHPKMRLAYLDLRQFFSPGARLTSCARYVKVMGQFARLVSVRMDLLRLTYLGVEDLSNPDLARSVDTLIIYLADVFQKTLTKLCVHVRPDMELSADMAVVGLVRRCLLLSELNVTFAVQAATFVLILETIHRHRNASLRGAKKTRLRLNIRGMTPELDQTIRQLTSGGFSDVSRKTMS